MSTAKRFGAAALGAASIGLACAFALAPQTLRADSGAAADDAGEAVALGDFERLSLDLRGRPLDSAERRRLVGELAKAGPSAIEVYERHVDAWLSRDAIKGFVRAFLRFPPVAVVDPDGETFFRRLAKHGQGTDAVYYLPHAAANAGGVPCPAGEVERVAAWWARGRSVDVCRTSHLPDVIFDSVGYCSGEAEPLMRQPPRPGCGCGPVLMGCLPPVGEEPELDALVTATPLAEFLETAARIVAEGRPLDELLTASETWQTGLAVFLYLRRDLIGLLAESGWSPRVQRQIERRLAAVDVYAPGRWIRRGGVYEGTGLFWTALAPHALKVPVRAAAHDLLTTYLCSDFHAVNVDSEAILQAVGEQNDNLRTLSSITAAPMRFQEGCRGCHAPMDGAAGFFGEIQGPLYGSFPTGARAEGEFFVAGAEDLRAKGVGIAALARYVAAQPEFETCAVRRAFEQVLKRPVQSHDQRLFDRLVDEFRSSGHRWSGVVRGLLVSAPYRAPSHVITPAAGASRGRAPAASAVPAELANLLAGACAGCHDEDHRLDLSRPPARSDVETWQRILTKVSDYSMPPPVREGDVAARFPLDPSARRQLTTAIVRMLGPALDRLHPPRRLPHRAWLWLVRHLAEPVLGARKLEPLLEPANRVLFAKLPPRGLPPEYQLAIEQVGEAVCREVSRTDPRAIGTPDTVLSKLDWRLEQDRARSTAALLRAVYGTDPSSAELSEARQLLERFNRVTGDWRESWTALCSTHLTGPRLLLGAYR